MALKLLKRLVFEEFQTGEGPNGEPEEQLIGWNVEELHFDTTTQLDVASTRFQSSSPAPEQFELGDGDLVHEECGLLRSGLAQPADAETTFWTWRYSQLFGATGDPVAQVNSTSCGYVAPTCDLTAPTVSVSGTTATISVTGNRGQLRYSRDGGISLQSSNVFANLVASQPYTVRVVDLGVQNCFREVSFTASDQGDGGSDPDPDTPPTPEQPPTPADVPTLVESLSYVLGTVFETITAGEYRTVRLELWMETSHYNRDYQRIVELEKRADAAGGVSFQLDRMLAANLQPETLDLLSTQASIAGQVVRNYFCRWRTVNAATGALGPWANCPLRTALLSGLELEDGWLTTQPVSKHVLLNGQPEFLFFLTPPTAAPDLRVRRVLEVDNLPPAVADETILLPPSASGRRVLVLPVFNTGSLPANARRLSISVIDDEELVLGEARQYELTIAPASAQKLFLFATPVGGIDTLLTRGASTATLEVKPAIAERGAYAGQPPRTPLRTVYDLDESRTFRVATGWLTTPQQRWLQTFMLSRRHWLATEEPQLEPVLISKRQMTYQRSDPRTEGLSFDYELLSEAAGWNQLKPTNSTANQ